MSHKRFLISGQSSSCIFFSSCPLLSRNTSHQSASLRSQCLRTTTWRTPPWSIDNSSRAGAGTWAWTRKEKSWRATMWKRTSLLHTSSPSLWKVSRRLLTFFYVAIDALLVVKFRWVDCLTKMFTHLLLNTFKWLNIYVRQSILGLKWIPLRPCLSVNVLSAVSIKWLFKNF